MRIYSLLDDRNQEKVTYSYTKRQLNVPYYPDIKCERVNKTVYDRTDGNLFYGKEVSWNGEKLLDRSIDINISFQGERFIDHVSLIQSVGSKPGSIEILTKERENLIKIGVLSKGGFIEEEQVDISVGYFCDNIIIRLNGAYENVGLKKLDVFAVEGMKEAVYPIPEHMEIKEGTLPFVKMQTICPRCQEAYGAAIYLKEKIEKGFKSSFDVDKDGYGIVMTLVEREDDGFEIEVSDDGCHITAGTKRGFFYASDALIQLMNENGIKKCVISDKPMMEFRGVHLALPSRDEIPFFKKLVKEVFVPMRYNAVLLQISAAMRYDKYPEINEKWRHACEMYEKGEWPMPAHYDFVGRDILEKEEVAQLCEYIRSFGLEIIPEVQCLSHSQYITAAYPHLAELEKKEEVDVNLHDEDVRPSVFYYHNMCPSHKEYYDYVFGITEEVIDVIKPERYIHMGHDEVYKMGVCEECSQKGAVALFVEEVNRLNEYIKSKSLTMMIWSDMLQCERHSVPEAINEISRDIIMLDFAWYFHPEEDLEDRLLNHGFQVIMGNMYSSHYTRYDSRSKKRGIMGAQVSTWTFCKEHWYAYKGKMYDIVYSANCMWSSGYESKFRLTYNEIIKPILWRMRCDIAEFNLDGETSNIAFEGDIKKIPVDLLWKIPYEKAAQVSLLSPELAIPIGREVDTIVVVHATDLSADRMVWRAASKIGEYEIVYEDGDTVVDNLFYSTNIRQYSHTYGMPIKSFMYRHEGYPGTYLTRPLCGKDNQGKDYTLLEYPIKNVHPDKKVEKIILRHLGNTDARILLFDVKIVKA